MNKKTKTPQEDVSSILKDTATEIEEPVAKEKKEPQENI